MKDHGMVEDICELAERSGERPPAPSWHHGKYPDLAGLNRDGDPVRDFEQDFPTGFRGCYVDMSCQDVLTAHGVQRSPTLVHVGGRTKVPTIASSGTGPRNCWKLRTRPRRSEP